MIADHVLDVVEEALDAVMPRDEHYFNQAEDESRKSGGVRVDQLQDVNSALRTHRQSQKVHHQSGTDQDESVNNETMPSVPFVSKSSPNLKAPRWCCYKEH